MLSKIWKFFTLLENIFGNKHIIHVFFLLLDCLLLFFLFISKNETVFPFLLLISVIAIAGLTSLRLSFLYLTGIVITVGIYHFLNSSDPIIRIVEYGIAAFLLCLPSWVLVNELQISHVKSRILTEKLKTTVTNSNKRAQQLGRILETDRIANTSANQEQLIHDAIILIQSHFKFYYVGIYLIDQTATRLVLEQAVGEPGLQLPKEEYYHTVGQASIVGRAALNRQVHLASDMGEDPYIFKNSSLPDTRAEAAIPLMVRDNLLGVLDIRSRDPDLFDSEYVSILQVIANQISAGISNTTLSTEINEQASLITELQSITNLMSQQANTPNALNVVAQKSITLFKVDGGSIYLFRPETDDLNQVINWDDSATDGKTNLRPGEKITGRAFVQNKTLSIENYTNRKSGPEDHPRGEIYAAIAIPLRQQNEPIGVLTLTRTKDKQPFNSNEIIIAELLAAQVSSVIVNNQLIEETRRLAKRERTISQAAAQIRRSLDAKTILETMTDELGNLLGNRVIKARLYPQQESRIEEKDLP